MYLFHVLLYVTFMSIYSFAIILMGKRELVAWLSFVCSLQLWYFLIILTILRIYLHYYINMPNSYLETFTFFNRDVTFSPRDEHSYIEMSYGK